MGTSTRLGQSIITSAGTKTSSQAGLASTSRIKRPCRGPRRSPADRRPLGKHERGERMTTLRTLIAAALVIATFGWALAKLPPPPPMDDKAKAAAEEKKAKDAAAADAAKAAQARAEDRVVARYMAEQKAKGKTVTPQMASSSGAEQKGAGSDAKMKDAKAAKK